MRSVKHNNQAEKLFRLDELELVPVRLQYDEEHLFEYKIPKFLYEAFSFIKNRQGFCTEGIFRKQGNNSRVEGAEVAFSGRVPIPSDCTELDVAVLIKRFFSRIEGGIFSDKETQIISFGTDYEGKPLRKLDGLFTMMQTLPPINRGTLAYLMAQLKKISQMESNRMEVHNLSVVFAPSLFVNASCPDPSVDVKAGIDLIVTVVSVLIENHKKLASPPFGPRAVVGRHPPGHARAIGLARAMSSCTTKPTYRSNSCHPTAVPSTSVPLPMTHPRISSSSVHSNSVDKPQSVSERESRDLRKQGNKASQQRRGSSVVRQIRNLGGVMTKLLPGRRVSGAGAADECPSPRISLGRRNPSSGNLGTSNPARTLDRCSSFRGPNVVSADLDLPPLLHSPKKPDLQRHTSVFSLQNPPTDRVAPPESAVEPIPKPASPPCQSSTDPPDPTPPLSSPLPSKPAGPRDVPLKKLRRHTAPVKTSLKRNQPNTVAMGLKDGRKAVRRSTMNFKHFNDENFGPCMVEKEIFRRFSRNRSKSTVAPERPLMENINETCRESGLQPIHVKPSAPKPNGSNVASLVSLFDSRIKVHQT